MIYYHGRCLAIYPIWQLPCFKFRSKITKTWRCTCPRDEIDDHLSLIRESRDYDHGPWWPVWEVCPNCLWYMTCESWLRPCLALSSASLHIILGRFASNLIFSNRLIHHQMNHKSFFQHDQGYAYLISELMLSTRWLCGEHDLWIVSRLLASVVNIHIVRTQMQQIVHVQVSLTIGCPSFVHDLWTRGLALDVHILANHAWAFMDDFVSLLLGDSVPVQVLNDTSVVAMNSIYDCLIGRLLGFSLRPCLISKIFKKYYLFNFSLFIDDFVLTMCRCDPWQSVCCGLLTPKATR